MTKDIKEIIGQAIGEASIMGGKSTKALKLVDKTVQELKEIKTTFGGPCIYKQGIFEDGTTTGKIQDIGQSKEELERELLDSVGSGRDDVKSFIDRI